jgi:hypothetical protein
MDQNFLYKWQTEVMSAQWPIVLYFEQKRFETDIIMQKYGIAIELYINVA